RSSALAGRPRPARERRLRGARAAPRGLARLLRARALAGDHPGAGLELAHLVPARGGLMGRRLGVCALLGVALYVVKGLALAALPPAPYAVEVTVPRGAGEAEVARRVEEAILVEEGLRFGWVEDDPVIRGRLAMNMAFLEEAPRAEGRPVDEAQKVEAALALGMQRTDPVVRQRLAARVRSLLGLAREAPARALLEAHLAA